MTTPSTILGQPALFPVSTERGRIGLRSKRRGLPSVAARTVQPSKPAMATPLPIKVADLKLDLENPRLGQGLKSQPDAIHAMLRAEGKKTLQLAEDILQNGLNVAERPMVIRAHDDPNRYVVLEGNRRLTALRILAEPSSAAAAVKKPTMKKIEGWSTQYHKNPVTEIDCVLYDDREEAEPWIIRRHMGEAGGKGVVGWGPIEQRRHDARLTGKPSLDLQAFDLVAGSGDLDEDTREKLHDFPITNLERLLEDGAVLKRLGLALDKNRQLTSALPDDELLKPLTRMVRDIAMKKINVNDIRHESDRANYLNKFKPTELPNLKKAGTAQRVVASRTAASVAKKAEATGPGKRASAKQAKPRRSIVHPRCQLTITSPKISAIFQELRDMPVDDLRNSVGVMLRVFLELTVDHYRTQQKLPALPKGKDTLAHKLRQASTDLVARKVMTQQQVKGINHAASEKHTIGANITTFNQFVHNPYYSPLANDLRTYWDNLQSFFEVVRPK
jgi:hypothetical protein